MNRDGSIVPLLVVFMVIVIAGVIMGVIGLFISPLMNSDNSINSFMSWGWMVLVPVVVLVVCVGYSVVRAQRGGMV